MVAIGAPITPISGIPTRTKVTTVFTRVPIPTERTGRYDFPTACKIDAVTLVSPTAISAKDITSSNGTATSTPSGSREKSSSNVLRETALSPNAHPNARIQEYFSAFPVVALIRRESFRAKAAEMEGTRLIPILIIKNDGRLKTVSYIFP